MRLVCLLANSLCSFDVVEAWARWSMYKNEKQTNVMEMLEILLIWYDILAFWAWKLQLKLVVILACHFCNNNNCRDFCTSSHLYFFYCQPKIKLGFLCLTYYYEEFANKEVKRKMNGRNEQTNVQKGWVHSAK